LAPRVPPLFVVAKPSLMRMTLVWSHTSAAVIVTISAFIRTVVWFIPTSECLGARLTLLKIRIFVWLRKRRAL